MKSSMDSQIKLLRIYDSLLNYFGHQSWWPSTSHFETIIGAILAQGVAWKNVTMAIENLKENDLLNPKKLLYAKTDEIAIQIKPSRFYNQKSKKIKNFIIFYYNDYNADLALMASEETDILRDKLLKVNGLGEETVDSILLYACEKPIFVVDTYTKRIFSRYGLLNPKLNYKEVQHFFMKNLPSDIKLFNDYHAQIVNLGNKVCTKNPLCTNCPIKEIDEDIRCLFYDNRFQ